MCECITGSTYEKSCHLDHLQLVPVPESCLLEWLNGGMGI